MNLFAGLRGRGASPKLDLQMAVMCPIVAAMLADGRVEDSELLQIHAICLTSPIFERNSKSENDRLIMTMARMIEDYGFETVCGLAAAVLTPALRETAFTNAAQVIFSDGYVGPLEQSVMEDLAAALEIPEDRARVLVEVVSVTQHPATA